MPFRALAKLLSLLILFGCRQGFESVNLASQAAPNLSLSSPVGGATVMAISNVTGTCDVGSTISVAGDLRQPSASVSCASDGTFSVSIKVAKSSGAHALEVTARSAAGVSTTSRVSVAYAGDVDMGVNLFTMCTNYAGHWTYPADNPSVVWDFRYYKSKGLTLFRFPIQWESIQNTLYGPLTTWQVSCLHDVLNSARLEGVKLVFDLHNYGRYTIVNDAGKMDVTNATNYLLGSSDVPISAMVDVWTKLATEFSGDSALYGYDLMNEPHDMLNAGVWPSAVQQSITAIRAVDNTTPIIVEGDSWASATNWVAANPNLTPTDPANKLIFEAHQYFDAYGAGQYTSTYDAYAAYPDLGVDLVKPFVNWLKTNGYRGYVGEFGVPANDPRWLAVLDRCLEYLALNGISATAWSGGYIWGTWGQETAWFNLDPAGASTMPANPVDKAPVTILQKYPISAP